MPIINNINNGYNNNNNRKMSSQLTFEVGERFSGRVVDKGDGNDIVLRTKDGWQFIAETEDTVNIEQLKLVNFEVEGFQDGKLKLKVIKGTKNQTDVDDESFQEIIEKEGLSKEDINTLKSMVKHNIPLTRENINQVKGLIVFAQKLNDDPHEMDNFIKNYLQSSDIDPDSSEGQNMKQVLTEFLNKFKDMSAEDILTFLENKLEFSKENIDSFNNIFKGDFSIEKLILKINDAIGEDILSNGDLQDKGPFMNNDIQNLEANGNINDNATVMATKIYNNNDPSNNKVDVLNILKTLAGHETENDKISDIQSKEIDLSEKNQTEEEILNLPKEISNKLQNDKSTVNTIKNIIVEEKLLRELSGNTKNDSSNETAKIRVEKFLSTQFDKEIKLTDSEFKEISQFIDKKMQEDKVIPDSAAKNIPDIKELKKDVVLETTKELYKDSKNFLNDRNDNNDIKNQIKEKINNVSDAVKNILSHLEADESVYSKITTMIKNNINDIKVFNTMNNEYYYINVPITNNSEEYPCKLIIKDNRKDGKKIDSTNAKMVVNIKTINLGDVDGFISMTPNKINIQIQCEDKYTSMFEKYKNRLVEGLSASKSDSYISVTVKSKKQDNNIVNTREFFNDKSLSNIDVMV